MQAANTAALLGKRVILSNLGMVRITYLPSFAKVDVEFEELASRFRHWGFLP